MNIEQLTKYFHDPVAQRWLLAAAVVFGVTFALRALRSVVMRLLARSERTAPQVVRDMVYQCARHTGWAFQSAVGILVARYVVDVPRPWDRRLTAVLMVLFIFQAGLWATRIIDRLILARLDRAKGTRDMEYRTGRSLLRSMGLVVIWSGAMLLALENLGIHVSTLVAGLGITGVAVAFATQNILSDLIASISILLDKPFLVNDFIVVDTYMGSVERIGVRTTRLRSLSGEMIIFSNSDLAKSRVRNYKRMSERRVTFTFSVAYTTPADKLRRVGGWVKEIVEAQDKTRFDRAHWLSFADPGLTFECVFYVLDSDVNMYMDIQQEINLAILEKCQAEGVSFAYGQFRWIPTSGEDDFNLPEPKEPPRQLHA